MSWVGGGEGRDGWKQDISYMGNMVEGNADEHGSQKAKLASRQQFAGYEGSNDKLMEDMIGHCAVAVFISGPYSNRSPACLRELMVATEKNVPIIYAQYQSGQLPRSLESYLYKKSHFLLQVLRML